MNNSTISIKFPAFLGNVSIVSNIGDYVTVQDLDTLDFLSVDIHPLMLALMNFYSGDLKELGKRCFELQS